MRFTLIALGALALAGGSATAPKPSRASTLLCWFFYTGRDPAHPSDVYFSPIIEDEAPNLQPGPSNLAGAGCPHGLEGSREFQRLGSDAGLSGLTIELFRHADTRAEIEEAYQYELKSARRYGEQALVIAGMRTSYRGDAEAAPAQRGPTTPAAPRNDCERRNAELIRKGNRFLFPC